MDAIEPRMEQLTVHTRASLLAGVQRGNEDSWHDFYRIYSPVIRGFALKAGLTETEADEVVQETCIGVMRNVGEFRYDPVKCRFKTWLLNLASWRVKNQWTKRQRWDERVHPGADHASARGARILGGDDTTRTTTIERLADLSSKSFDAFWQEQWRIHLLKAAIEKIRGQFTPTQFQIFDLYVIKQWPAYDVAKSLGMSLASVYLAKHRVSAAVKKAVARIERQMDRQMNGS